MVQQLSPSRRLFRVIAVAVGLSAIAPSGRTARAQESSLRAERVVPYATGVTSQLKVKVGPVNVQSVEFSDRGRIASGLPGLRAPVPEMSTTLRGHFVVENPSSDEWEVTFTLEFRDKAGKVIDRAVKKGKWEGEAKPLDLDHAILAYVVPMIADVRITLEARLS
jgi:hypothetical protein